MLLSSRFPFLAAVALLVTHAVGTTQAPSYGRDVRPILAANCFRCHGPDAADRKAKLRLDLPGHGREAEIRTRLRADNPRKRMPPPESGKTLTPAQIEVLERWLDAGSPYEKHWSFTPPVSHPVPEVAGVSHPVDRFVRARLQEPGVAAAQGLTPSPPADRWTLVRRVFLDLIGLPPTPAEAAAFVHDPNPDAYAALVDALLARPQFGERQARLWLDLARYADTNGYEKDRPRSIWPYRDWVIRACNDDLPYDQFVVEQLAGDMLPDPTPAQRIATGFHRNTMLNEEGGIDPLEFRFYAVVDRVATTGTAIMGLTLGCAQCHTHKFDPITHTEYYQLFAFFNNADEPDYQLPDPEGERARAQEAERAVADALAGWKGGQAALDAELEAWVTARRPLVGRWQTLQPSRATAPVPFLRVAGDGTVDALGDTTKHDVYTLEFAAGDRPVVALRLDALADPRLPGGGPGTTFYEGRKGDFFLSEFRVFVGDEQVAIRSASESYSKNRFGRAPVPARLATDGDLQTGWSIADGIGRDQSAAFHLATPIPGGQRFRVEMHFGRHFASSLGRFRLAAAGPGDADEAELRHSLGPTVDALIARPATTWQPEDLQRLREAYLFSRRPQLAQRVHSLRRPTAGVHTLVMEERPALYARVTHRHHRGEFLRPKEVVRPGVPAALPAWPETLPRNRLGLARWLVDPEHPLTARVAVNRLWAQLFGRGLVETVDDFGMQGAAPSHPELLDWLAKTFVRQGWSRKAMLKLLVTSETYRQSAVVRPVDARLDPGNRWLARAPRLRLEAEVLRDQILHASGSLSLRMFGAPVRPVQPAGVTEVAYGGRSWRPDSGEKRVRRSLYTFAKRTAPFAFFQTFDAPSGEACVARRDRSNSALQSLTLLNDPAMVDAARALGLVLAHVAAVQGTAVAVREGFQRAVTRPPGPAEVERLTAFVERQRQRFAADPATAAQLAGRRKERASETASEVVDLATWIALSRVLFALDEAVNRG